MNKLCVKDLKQRGWTDALIAKHLGAPDATAHGRNNIIRLYSQERAKRVERRVTFQRDLTASRERRSQTFELQPCDLLSAMFAVNRAAKRWRDSARSRYHSRLYAWATNAKEHKEYLYSLKDRGIAAAYTQGRIAPVELHGGLCLWRGEGYVFHSTLIPREVALAGDQTAPITVEAKPQGSREPKQRDAIATLAGLQRWTWEQFTTLEKPRFEEEEFEEDFDENFEEGF